jgi:GT2 family glycosyltransferase
MSKTDSPPQVAIVIVSYNTRDLLLECLASTVSSAGNTPVEIVVVDNGSTDGSAEAASEAYRQIQLIENPENVGFGAACNQAFEATRSPFVLLLNSDARLTTEAFQALCDCMATRPDCAAAGCLTVNAEGREITSTRHFLTPLNQVIEQSGFPAGLNLGWINRTYLPRPDDAGIDCNVDWIEGACLLLRREALAQTGHFDERFFMYSEEEDLCRRLKQRGWSICYCAGGKVEHLGGASSRENRTEMLRQFYSGQMMFLHKHRGPLSVSLFAAAMKSLLAIKHLYYEMTEDRRLAEEFGQRLAAFKKARAVSISK